MGGSPVTTEPAAFAADEEVTSILMEAGLVNLFQKFHDHDENLSSQVAASWKEGRCSVNGQEMVITRLPLSEISGLSLEGEVVSRDKTNQTKQIASFLREGETFCWLDSGIGRTSLPAPWDRVAMTVMKYMTLEGKFRKLYGFHVKILNFIRHKHPTNIPDFLYCSIERSILQVQQGQLRLPLHQGLILLLVSHLLSKSPPREIKAIGWPKGKKIGTPISKQDLLEAVPLPKSAGKAKPSTAGKGSSNKKRKLPPSETDGARRSTRLQAKGRKPVIVSTEEDTEDTTDESAKPANTKQHSPEHCQVSIYLGKELSMDAIKKTMNSLAQLSTQVLQTIQKIADGLKDVEGSLEKLAVTKESKSSKESDSNTSSSN